MIGWLKTRENGMQNVNKAKKNDILLKVHSHMCEADVEGSGQKIGFNTND